MYNFCSATKLIVTKLYTDIHITLHTIRTKKATHKMSKSNRSENFDMTLEFYSLTFNSITKFWVLA